MDAEDCFNDVLINDYKLSWLERMSLKVLSHGRIPRHLAVIMDGNRRFAKLRQQKAIVGHSKGFTKLSEVLFWCRELNIREVTVYAFSIENFKRTKEEVDALLDLAERAFTKILQDRKKLDEEGVCIRIIGNMSHLPVTLQQLCADLMLTTRHHSNRFVNIALSYTAREEMCHAIDDLIAGANEGIVKSPNFNEALLSSAMYSKDSPDPDLLIRTSGEVRLSDFLLWQTGFTVVEFLPSLWPDLNIWHFMGAIVNFQWQARKLQRYLCKSERSIDTENFDRFVEERRDRLLRDASLGNVTQNKPRDCIEEVREE